MGIEKNKILFLNKKGLAAFSNCQPFKQKSWCVVNDLYYIATPPGEQSLKVKTFTIKVELKLLVLNYICVFIFALSMG